MIDIRYAEDSDKAFWYSLDRHLPEQEYAKKVRDRQCYILSDNGEPRGLLRYNLFWDNTPFCTLLFVAEGFRGKGHGTRLMAHWEAEMARLGYGMALVSTQADETSQQFYRKIGYRDCGGLTLDSQPMEIFLVKELHTS